MERLDDDAAVRRQYAHEERLHARASIYGPSGDAAIGAVVETIAAGEPGEVLEVGSGPGALAARLQRERGLRVTAVDRSPRMVQLTRARGVDAREADIRALPFDDASFDTVVAAWMLYHVDRLDAALAEVARVLRPGGRFVAVTNSELHLSEMWGLLGMERYPLGFSAENGADLLARHFGGGVDRRDLSGPVTFPDRERMHRYVASSIRGAALADRIPAFDGPFTATRRNAIFLAVR